MLTTRMLKSNVTFRADKMLGCWIDLEALSVDNAGSRLVVLLLADPHLLEG